MYCRCVDINESVHIQQLKERRFCRISSIRNNAHLFSPKQICKHILAQFPAATSNQCPPHWSYLVSVPLPLLSQNGCISMLPVTSDRLRQGVQADTPGSGTEGSGEDGRSECKQSLSLNCHWGSGALCVCVRPRPQDKNVFDIVCNCVMFTLLVSERVCISKQAFDCQLWWGEAFLSEFNERQQEV